MFFHTYPLVVVRPLVYLPSPQNSHGFYILPCFIASIQNKKKRKPAYLTGFCKQVKTLKTWQNVYIGLEIE